MNSFCPVTDKRINENIARLNAVFTFVLVGIYIATQNIIPIAFLAIDFLLRAADQAQYSIVAIASRSIARYLSLNENLINAGPKIFAARIGLIFSVSIVIAYFLNAGTSALIVAGILGFFSILESVFGLCVACSIYPYVYRLFYK